MICKAETGYPFQLILAPRVSQNIHKNPVLSDFFGCPEFFGDFRKRINYQGSPLCGLHGQEGWSQAGSMSRPGGHQDFQYFNIADSGYDLFDIFGCIFVLQRLDIFWLIDIALGAVAQLQGGDKSGEAVKKYLLPSSITLKWKILSN